MTLFWSMWFYNETTISLPAVSRDMLCQYRKYKQIMTTMSLVVRSGDNVLSPIRYPLMPISELRLYFPPMDSRQPPQFYEYLLMAYKFQSLCRLKLYFDTIRKAALRYLSDDLISFLMTFGDSMVRGMSVHISFPKGVTSCRYVRKSSARPIYGIRNSGVHDVLFEILHMFSIKIFCVYMGVPIRPEDVIAWITGDL